MLGKLVRSVFDTLGVEIRRKRRWDDSVPVEWGPREREILDYVVSRQLTMTTVPRLVATIASCRHVALSGLPGAFVECGVWRGGNALAAKLVFESLKDDRPVYLFDTFAGMTAPTDADRSVYMKESTQDFFNRHAADGRNDWCYASLEDVLRNFEKAGVDLATCRFVKGDVLETLKDPSLVPEQIAVLRLDTDWYESTLVELEVLYPRLVIGGSLLIDDYGHWDGARKAVEEYFARPDTPSRPLLHVTDYTGRAGVKVI